MARGLGFNYTSAGRTQFKDRNPIKEGIEVLNAVDRGAKLAGSLHEHLSSFGDKNEDPTVSDWNEWMSDASRAEIEAGELPQAPTWDDEGVLLTGGDSSYIDSMNEALANAKAGNTGGSAAQTAYSKALANANSQNRYNYIINEASRIAVE